jgi:hypothetical protein
MTRREVLLFLLQNNNLPSENNSPSSNSEIPLLFPLKSKKTETDSGKQLLNEIEIPIAKGFS